MGAPVLYRTTTRHFGAEEGIVTVDPSERT
jgi:hypothetical protein